MSDLFDDLIPKSKARRRQIRNSAGIAEQIKSLRIDRGLTQEELAEEAQVGLAQVRKLEQGKTNVNLTTLTRILTALKGSLKVVDETL